jgi:Xaa-Pro aminopeptidase
MLGPTADGRLADRTPVTVEPGVYLPGRGGVRIEDTLVVRDGAPDLLTTTPKDLLVL